MKSIDLNRVRSPCAAVLLLLCACNRNAKLEQRTASGEQKLVTAQEAPLSPTPALEPPGSPGASTLAPSDDPRTALPPGDSPVHFGVIGDFGHAGPGQAAVARLVKSWQPEFIITAGDNNYPDGEQATIDDNIGQYWSEFIAPYRGRYGKGATENRFFPSLGNHDWITPGAKPHLDYFELPGNERYYDFVKGAVHFFALDSDPAEPDGVDAASKQAAWLKHQLSKSTARWQVVYLHHAPYSSGSHGSDEKLQWPYQEWGADLVVAGHDHTYERILVKGLPYLVIGLGGRSIYPFRRPLEGTQFRYNSNFGALRVAANNQGLISYFLTVDGQRRDQLVLP